MLRLASVDRAITLSPLGTLFPFLRRLPFPPNCASPRHPRQMTTHHLPSRPSDLLWMAQPTRKSSISNTTCPKAKHPHPSHRPSSSPKIPQYDFPMMGRKI